MSSGMYADGIKALASITGIPESLPEPDREASVDNPFCGDRIHLQANLEGGRLTAVAQEVRACMLCQASANLLAGSAIGLSQREIELVSTGLVAMLKGEGNIEWPPVGWEPLALFEPVANHKSRHGCVTLPFEALLKALS